jgi:hypothetical protein
MIIYCNASLLLISAIKYFQQFAEQPGRITRLSRRNGGHRFSSLRHYTFKSKDKSFDKGNAAKTSPPTPTKEDDSPPQLLRSDHSKHPDKTIQESSSGTEHKSPVSSVKSEAPASEATGHPVPTAPKKKKKKCVIM